MTTIDIYRMDGLNYTSPPESCNIISASTREEQHFANGSACTSDEMLTWLQAKRTVLFIHGSTCFFNFVVFEYESTRFR